MDLVGELNRLAGVPVAERMGAAGAANLWAGTTGLELVGALNAKAGLPVNGTSLELNGVLKRLGFDLDSNGALVGGVDGTTNVANVLRLPGVAGNYLTTPDNSALQVTGDIDLRMRAAADSWLPNATGTFHGKWGAAGHRSLAFQLATTGALALVLSQDGTASTSTTSGVVTGFADGAAGWVRVTWRASDGRVQFFTSTDGVTYAQSGTDKTIALASIFDSDSAYELGGHSGGTSPLAGRVYYAEIRSGIAGNVVASFDASTVAVRGDQTPTTVRSVPWNRVVNPSFETDTTGWTGLNSTLARITTDAWDGAASLQQTVTNTSNPSVQPTPIVDSVFAVTPGQTYSMDVYVKAVTAARSGQVKVAWYNAAGSFVSQAVSSISVNTVSWTRNGVSGVAPSNAVYGIPTVTWTSAQVADVFLMDAFAFYQGNYNYYVPPTTWTVNGTAWWWDVYSGTKLRTNSFYRPGSSGSYPSTPDSAALSITGDIDLRVKAAMDQWQPGSDRRLLSKYDTATNNRSYSIYYNSTTGKIAFAYSADGITPVLTDGFVPAYANGTPKWIRVTMAVATGQKIFYDSDDGITWTTKATVAGSATSIFDGAAVLELGSRNNGSADSWAGKFYYAEVRNGIGGTVVASFNPDALRITGPQTPSSWTGSAGNVWTGNGSAWFWVVD